METTFNYINYYILDNMNDYIIIGGGIGGLYANYLLASKKKTGVLLEKNQTVFGRVREREFHGIMIKCAAGIAVPENKLLIKLFKKLGMPVKFSIGGIKDMILPAFDMAEAVKRVKRVFKTMTKKDLHTLNSKEILYKYFDKDFADKFIEHSEFGDYLKGSFEYLMKYYPISDLDNTQFEMMGVDWTMLVNKLSLPNIKTEYEVKKIEKKGSTFIVNDDIQAKQVIFAVTIGTLTKIECIGFKMPDVAEFVGSIPFSRVYAFYKDGYEMKDGYVKVGGAVDKIIKINKNIVMASYADGDNAIFWGKVKKMPEEEQQIIVQEKLNEVGFDFGKPDDIFVAFWTDGVHYIKPYGKFKTIDSLLNKLSHPQKNVFIIGEILSKRVGYVEGALLCVERMIKK